MPRTPSRSDAAPAPAGPLAGGRGTIAGQVRQVLPSLDVVEGDAVVWPGD
jgi:hypothetical protein